MVDQEEKKPAMTLDEAAVDILCTFRDQVFELAADDETGRLYELAQRIAHFIQEHKA